MLKRRFPFPARSGFLARFLTRVFGQGFGDGDIQCTVLPGRRSTVLQFYRDGNIQFYNTTGMEKNGGENHVVKIPYVENLDVGELWENL